jgi:predicted permease
MTRFARLRSWIRASLHSGDFDRSVRDEMETHVEMYEADLRRRGIPAAEAHRRARAEFGSIAARREECREAVGLRLFDELRGDVRFAIRLLRQSPTFSLIALLSLGLGIGANTAIFSLIDTVLVKFLPVEEPQRLFFIDNSGGKSGGSSGPPYPCYERMRDHNRFLSGIAAFSEGPFKVTIDGAPEQVFGQHASGSYFDVLGVTAIYGRVLTPADDSIIGRGGPDGAVAVISHGFWERRFGRDPAVLGKSIQVGTDWVTIVGVTPPDFFGLQVGSPIDITVPMMLSSDNVRMKQSWWMSVVGRIKADASVANARDDLNGLFDAYMDEIGFPRKKRDYFSGIELVPAARGLNALRRDYSEPLLIIMAIVAVVLLIGCANAANLLLARASARQNEMAVRLAIGASRSRLVRQLITEGAVLVSLGALLGLLCARWGVSFLVRILAGPAESLHLQPQFDWRVLGFTGLVAVVTAILFSLAPALHATRADAAKPVPAGMSSSRSRVRLGQSLVVIQVMLSVVLLCGAALFLRTLHNLEAVDAGFNRQGVLTVFVESTPPDARRRPFEQVRRPTPAESRQAHARLGVMWEDFIARVAALPGVTLAAAATMSPLTGNDRGVVIAVSGRSVSESDRSIHVNQVTADYFSTLGIRLLSGRTFTRGDRAGSLRVAILNDTAVRTYFPGENPIGRKVSFPGQRVEDEYEIVGIVGDTRYRNLRTPDERMAYVPIEQSFDPISRALVSIHASADPISLVGPLRTLAAQNLPGGFVSKIGTVEQRLQQALVRERLLSMLATFFAGLALTLACIGLYGIMAYGVVRRTREIGIRVAIGAGERSVMWMVVRETLGLVVVGAGLGTLASLAGGSYLRHQLFGVSPGDPLAVAIAVLLLLGVTIAAGYLPARRATRINPVIALRYE